MILFHHSFASADTFSCREVFVRGFFTVEGVGNKYLVFGSGTKLIVTDEQVVKPVVSVYPAASRAHLEGKTSLLCLASGMVPPLVRFSWKRRKENGPLKELPPAEGEQVEFTESGRTVAIRVVDQDPLYTYKYVCSVQHEGATVEAQAEQEVSALPAPVEEPPDVTWFKERLFCALYTMLIAKTLVYSCGLSMLMCFRNK